ncbi:MAG: ParB/RepB/Spo0J family partition protein [Sporichthyaceae bacterium]
MTQARQRGLGRGLGALIPTAPLSMSSTAAEHLIPSSAESPEQSITTLGAAGAPAAEPTAVDGAWFAELPLSAIVPNAKQPRTVFDPDLLEELVHSIREVGLLQPIVVRPVADGQYELVMGERRWRASQLAGKTTVPAIVRRTEDEKMLLDALLENLHRAALNPLEEAAAYDQLLQEFDCTHDALAARLGRSRSQVSNTIRLLKLAPSVQRRVAAGVLSAGHARALLGIDNADDAEHLANRIVAEGLSVRAVEEIVALGETGRPVVRTRSRSTSAHAPALDELAARLADKWDTRVKVQAGGKGKGKLVVEFASMEDLERIVAFLDPTS